MATDKIRKYVLPNIPYLFIGWFCLKIGTAYRLAAGAGFGEKLLGLGQTIGAAFASFAPGLAPLDWLVGVVGAVGFRLLIFCKAKKAKKFRHDAEYGSARWGNEKDIKPFVDPKFENNMLLTATERLTMNTRPKNPANARNLNFCGIGSSGSGKTRFWLTPQLLQAHSSYVVVDPKGGVLGQVGAFLQRRGYQIKVFNSIDFSKSMHYNPLSYIRNEADILKFVNALITNTKGEGKEGDPFWTKAETLLYCALIAYIIFEGPAEDRNMNTLVDMISGMEVKEDDENYKNAVDYMFDGLAKRKPYCFAVKQYRKFKLSSGKTAKSILISCGARLAPFDIPQLREIMSYDELELDRMGDRRTATFFCISDTDSTYNFLVALAFSQMFNLLCERADNVHGGRLPHHVRVLWDEAANTGQVPQLEKLVAVIRSREISLCLLYQQLAQCKAIYDKNAETILGNMDSVLFLGGRESSTIKEISENWLGKATISMQTEGRSRGQSESYSQNTQRLGRELMTPSELATMPGDRCILQLRGLPPFYSKKYDLKQHPNYKYTAEADKVKNAFDLNCLVTRRMDKLNPNETYTVYKVDVPDEALTGEDEDILNYDDLDDPDAFCITSGHGGQRSSCRQKWRLFSWPGLCPRRNGGLMQFFASAVTTLQTLVMALGAGLAVWGVVNLLEGYGSDNAAAKSQGIKQLMAGGGIIVLGTTLIPLLSTLF
ncbi:MAG: VirD4-like conjugal transfer protein, CD1115 family [Faecalibacterium sp.]